MRLGRRRETFLGHKEGFSVPCTLSLSKSRFPEHLSSLVPVIRTRKSASDAEQSAGNRVLPIFSLEIEMAGPGTTLPLASRQHGAFEEELAEHEQCTACGVRMFDPC